MYPMDWVERLRQGRPRSGGSSHLGHVSPVVWSLGLTSLLTDVSTEMVGSILPVYLVLHLHLSPLQFAAIDGIYNGLSVALVAILAGMLADRSGRQKGVALFGYGLSAVCKLGLLLAGGAWGVIMLIVGLDRLGKGIRTAPRDSILSLSTRPELLGTAFGVHRALDATGALLGPLLAFVLLAQIPGAFDVLWVISFIVACLGVAALWLFVPSMPRADSPASVEPRRPAPMIRLKSPRFLGLGFCATLLALMTVSDGFIYLMIQQKSSIAPGAVPLFFVGTAIAYMCFAIPAGLLADRFGRTRVFAGGYVFLVALYGLVLMNSEFGPGLVILCLALLGLYYAATEGVLMALASSLIRPEARATGLAVLATSVGIGKLLSSIVFGWLWQWYGAQFAVASFAGGCAIVLIAVGPRLRKLEHG